MWRVSDGCNEHYFFDKDGMFDFIERVDAPNGYWYIKFIPIE